MRTRRILRPLPLGKGLFVRKHLLVLAAAALTLSVVPAQAAAVTVGFGLSVETYAPTAAACQVRVPSGSDGEAVLAAAQAAGCIVSYEVERHPTFGAFLTCINEVCGDDTSGQFLTFWKFYEDGAPASQGISDYSASHGSEVVFAYATWAGCLVAPGEPLC